MRTIADGQAVRLHRNLSSLLSPEPVREARYWRAGQITRKQSTRQLESGATRQANVRPIITFPRMRRPSSLSRLRGLFYRGGSEQPRRRVASRPNHLLTQVSVPSIHTGHTMHAGLAISRSQSVLSQASDSTEDYVEDSEPEREKRRLRKETHRKKTRAQTRSQPVVPMPSVIELTDSDDSAVQVHQFLQSDHLNSIVVFDVSGVLCRSYSLTCL